MKDRSPHVNQACLPATGRQRHLGAWLLLGWAAFWLTATVQLCCISFVAKSESSALTPIAHAVSPIAHQAGAPLPPSHPDTDCPDLGVAGPVMPGAATAVADRLDHLVTRPSPSLLLEPDYDARAYLASSNLYPPLSDAPLYLRTQRIRI